MSDSPARAQEERAPHRCSRCKQWLRRVGLLGLWTGHKWTCPRIGEGPDA